MQKKKYKAAIIGCGRIGSEFADDPRVDGIYSHAGAYDSCPETVLAAACDIDPVKLERCVKRWNLLAHYRNPEQMLFEQHPDIVSICTPDETHYSLIRAAIVADGIRAVLAEKPLALKLEQAREIVRLAQERDVLLAVNYTRRFAPSHIKLKEFLCSGGIGDIQTISGFYTGGTLHNGTHWFDLLRFLVGEVANVRGMNIMNEKGGDPTLDAYLEMECGASACLHGCNASAFTMFEMDVIGIHGRVRLIESGHIIETYQVVDSPRYTGYKALAMTGKSEGGFHNVLLHVVEDLVRCLNEGERPRCSGEDGVAALKIALAVRDSARSCKVMKLREYRE